jgi:hypothetical protein
MGMKNKGLGLYLLFENIPPKYQYQKFLHQQVQGLDLESKESLERKLQNIL